MASEVVNRQVVVNIVADDVVKAQETLLARQKKLNQEIAKTNDQKALADLNKQLKSTEQQIERNTKVLKGDLLPTFNQLTAAARRYYAEFKKTGDPEVLKKYYEVNAALKQTKAEMAGIEKASSSLTKGGVFSAGFWANLAANGVQRAASAFSSFFSGAITEALDAEEATARLSSTLDNLGRGDAFDRINRKADEMAQKFRYLDNDDIVGVFNKLIDYGKLTEKEMNDLIPVIIDFAAKSRTSIDDATDVIVKALEGNGKALKSYGIDLKDTGDETERLGILMTTLKSKVDGSGEAFQQTAKGGILTARQELKNLQEDIGNEIIPVLNKLLGFLLRAARAVKSFFISVRDGFDGGVKITGVISDAIERAKQKQLEQSRGGVTDIFQNVNDVIATESSKEPLGIADKAIAGNKTVAQKTKEVDELAASVKDLGDVIEKELSRRNAIIQGGGTPIGFGIDFEAGVDNGIARARAGGNRNALAALELQVLRSRGKKRLEAELQLLKEQERQELENKNLTENEKMLVEEQFRQKRKDAELNYFQQLVALVANYAKQALDILSFFNDAQTEKENAELARDARLNDKKIKNLESRLRKGLITQKQYEQEVDKIESEREKKERVIRDRQFRREKGIRLTQAIINTAEAVTEALPNLLLAALAGAAGAIQIDRIARSKPPEFARGGILGGRTHAQGGNAVVDGSGRKIAEIEAGEGIINRRSMADRRSYTLTGTPSQIASSLNSMNGNGVSWASPARYMNYGAINRRYYAEGGIFDDGSNSGSAIANLTSLLERGIKAYVVLTQMETQQQRMADIRADAKLNG